MRKLAMSPLRRIDKQSLELLVTAHTVVLRGSVFRRCAAGGGTLLPRHGVGVARKDITLNRKRRPTWVVIPHGLINGILWVDLPPDISIAQTGKCSHDTVAPTVDRTRLGASPEAIIYWPGTGSSNPSPFGISKHIT
jgi:hypothetical protein